MFSSKGHAIPLLLLDKSFSVLQENVREKQAQQNKLLHTLFVEAELYQLLLEIVHHNHLQVASVSSFVHDIQFEAT